MSAGNPGTPNTYETIEEAFEAVETLSADDSQPQDYVISLSDGEYFLEDLVTIDGSEISKNVASVKLEGDGNTSIKASRTVTEGFSKVTDEAILEKVPESAKSNIYAAKVDYDVGSGDLEVSVDGEIQHMARYPNKSSDKYVQPKYDKTTEKYTGDYTYMVLSNYQDADMNVAELKSGVSFETSLASRWNTADDMRVYYMQYYNNPVYKASASGNTVTVTRQADDRYLEVNGAVDSPNEFYVYNLIEELDAPGEYYYDESTGVLYTYGKPEGKVEIFGTKKEILRAQPGISDGQPLLKFADFENLTVEGIIFENAPETLLWFDGCRDTVLKDCTIRNGSTNAIRIHGTCETTGLLNCEIYGMGTGGVSLLGGDYATLIPAGNYVENCSLHDCQRLNRYYTALVSMAGVGNKILKSDIYNTYHQAISMSGNDHLIKDNDIYNVCNETCDMGAVYAEGKWTYRGTVFEHNYIHDVPNKLNMGVNVVYMDNGLSGVTVKNNIFEGLAANPVCINGGRDNTVTNNIFVDCGQIGVVSDILDWTEIANPPAAGDKRPGMLEDAEAQQNNPAYAKYTHFVGMLDDEPLKPKYNVFSGNVLVNISLPKSRPHGVSFDAVRAIPGENGLGAVQVGKYNDVLGLMEETYGGSYRNILEQTENGLQDYAGGNYNLKPEVAEEIGFTWFNNDFGCNLQ